MKIQYFFGITGFCHFTCEKILLKIIVLISSSHPIKTSKNENFHFLEEGKGCRALHTDKAKEFRTAESAVRNF